MRLLSFADFGFLQNRKECLVVTIDQIEISFSFKARFGLNGYVNENNFRFWWSKLFKTSSNVTVWPAISFRGVYFTFLGDIRYTIKWKIKWKFSTTFGINNFSPLQRTGILWKINIFCRMKQLYDTFCKGSFLAISLDHGSTGSHDQLYRWIYSCKTNFLWTKYFFENLGIMIEHNKKRISGTFLKKCCKNCV